MGPGVAGAGAGTADHPFDAVAATYDETFTDTRLGRWLRGQVWQRLEHCFAAGDRVLELGCGTGEDALWLAGRGVDVTALDASEGMLEVARRKAARRPAGERPRFLHWPLPAGRGPVDLPTLEGGGRFDGAFSSFGALNCVAELGPLGAALARRLRPGSLVVLVIMGPVCPWEIVISLLHGRPTQAFRRLRSGAPARVGGAAMPVWYPSPGRVRRELAPDFCHRRTVGVGVVLPPSNLSGLVERHPRLFRLASRIDPWAGTTWPGCRLADHYLCVFERVAN